MMGGLSVLRIMLFRLSWEFVVGSFAGFVVVARVLLFHSSCSVSVVVVFLPLRRRGRSCVVGV